MDHVTAYPDDTIEGTATPAEYNAGDPARRARSHAKKGEISRLRTGFFVLASIWGFLAGAIGYAVAAAPGGRDWGFLAAGAVAAIVGSVVFARAYDEMKRRRV